MSQRARSIPNLRTIKALSNQSLSIDLGKSYTGTLTAWMKREPTDIIYRSFDIIDSRTISLDKAKTLDYFDAVTLKLVSGIEGKWYFDVREEIIVGQPEVVLTGTILFENSITDSIGQELTSTNTQWATNLIQLTDTPSAYLPADAGKTLQVNATSTGIEFKSAAGDLNYNHTQAASSSLWVIPHSLGKYPSVTVIDSGGSLVFGDVQYIDINNISITFTASFSGSAFIN
jgi:hypothetical protein